MNDLSNKIATTTSTQLTLQVCVVMEKVIECLSQHFDLLIAIAEAKYTMDSLELW